MAVGDRSMASYRPGQKRSRLFARLNPNFASGRYTPPSKNLAQQPRLFRSADPYAAQSRVMQAMQQRLATGGTGGVPSTGMSGGQAPMPYAMPGQPQGGVQQPIQMPHMMPPMGSFDPTRTDAYGGAFHRARIAEAQQNFNPMGGGTNTADIVRAVQAGQQPGQPGMPGVGQPGIGIPGVPPGQNPNEQVRQAAQLFGGSVAGNPFMTPEALARLQAGYVPDENMINPAFYQYTSPVIQQALAGLRQSVGYRPEEQSFIKSMFTPAGLR